MKKYLLAIFAAVLVCFAAAAQPYPVGRPVPGYYPYPGQYSYPVEAPAMSPSTYSSFELAASYGLVSIVDFAYAFAGIFGAVYSFGTAVPDMHSTGVFTIEGYRPVSPRASFGGMVCLEKIDFGMSGRKVSDDGVTEYGPVDYQRRTFLSVMPSFKYRYFDNPFFSMYSKLAVGGYVAFGGEEDVDFGGAVQASLVGLEFGSHAVRGFAEFGFGMQGLASFGLSYRF